MRRVIAQSGMGLVGDSIGQPAQKIPGDTPGHAPVRFGASDLACTVDGNKHGEPARSEPYLGDN